LPGPFYFAWIAAPESYNPDYHAVEDEQVFSFSITHSEGDIPALSISVLNPRVGLLSRPVWAWLSWDKNWQREGVWTPDYKPLFLGRLLGIPNTINKEIVTLELQARPQDYAEQRDALAAGLRVLPYWDPIFISTDKWNDADVALEAYSRLWHFDRVSHEITLSDITVGEDGVEEFQEAEIPYDTVGLTLGTPPFTRVKMYGNAAWTQQFGGGISLINEVVHTYTGGSLISDWPAQGSNLGEGYVATASFAKDLWRTGEAFMYSSSISWSNPNEKHNPGDTMSSSQTISAPVAHSWLSSIMTRQTESGIGKSSVNTTVLYALDWAVHVHLAVQYQANRARNESCVFVMESNIQPVLTDPGDTAVKEITLNANDVAARTIDDSIPIGDIARASFFETDRGQLALQYLMLIARVNLIKAARCVEVTATIPFARAIELNCRKNGIIYDYRLPGGQAVGKIAEYTITADGNSGAMMGTVKLACAIGKDGTVSADPGEPTYVEDGYVTTGYQQYDGEIVVLPAGDVAYQRPLFAGEDDGLRYPLTASDIVVRKQWHGDVDDQADTIIGAFPVEAHLANLGQAFSFEGLDIIAAVAKNSLENQMADKGIWLELVLKNLNGKFTNEYPVTVIPLEIPRQIDLEFSDS
jgi:hypothetical protein